MMPDISPAADAELPAIIELLAANGLPTEDLAPQTRPEFLVIRDDGRLAGVVGLERFGHAGLLRSLAVHPGHRRHGHGIALTEAVERRAAQAGITPLFLLTQTAEAFFRHRGYRAIERNQAPADMQSNPQFRSLCPASAVCMMRELGAITPGATE
jgi:amino-acid N-acetyltransferase